MKLEEIQQLVDKDLKIESTQLHAISIDAPLLHNKYYKLLSRERLALKKIESDVASIIKEKHNYYAFNYQFTLDKKEVKSYIDGDEEVVKKVNLLELQKEKIKYLEAVIDNINRISFNIKNAIDFLKFTHGET